jgi:hypothetical protein
MKLVLIVCTRCFALIEALDCSTFGRGLVTSTEDMAERASRDRQKAQGSYANFGGSKFYRRRSESVSRVRTIVCMFKGFPSLVTFRIPSLRFATVKMPAPEKQLRAFSGLIAVKVNLNPSLDPRIASSDRAGCSCLNLNPFLYSKLQTTVWPALPPMPCTAAD